jgi:hypothetical protein
MQQSITEAKMILARDHVFMALVSLDSRNCQEALRYIGMASEQLRTCAALYSSNPDDYLEVRGSTHSQ